MLLGSSRLTLDYMINQGKGMLMIDVDDLAHWFQDAV